MPRGESVSEHQRYEELCALAAGGLLDGEEFADFQNHHQRECSECHADYQELHGLITRDLPQAQSTLRQKLAALRAKPLDDSRNRFLRRAQAEGVVFTREFETRAQSIRRYIRPVVLVSVATLLVGAVSLWVYHFRETPDTAQSNVAAAQQIADLKRQNSVLIANLSQLNESLATEQREIHNLHAQLGDLTATAENLRRSGELARGEAERSSSQTARLLEESRDQEKLLAEATDDAARNSQLRINTEASLVEQQTRITELSNKLRIASATLDMERQLVAAGKDIPELMASRELHVIDVRDTDPNGNRSKAFGRVFLTEGKSLTFYAFDLNADRVVNGKRGFQVWAVSEVGKNSPHSLGVLHVDAKAAGRWVLKVENPELVNQISSVFVTVGTAAGDKQPNGQKMLYAYLGAANHP